MPTSFIAVNHRQMPHAALGHQGHAVVRGLVGTHETHLRGHDFAHGSLPRDAVHQHDFAGIVTLGHDADDRFAVGHDQGANVASPAIIAMAS